MDIYVRGAIKGFEKILYYYFNYYFVIVVVEFVF